MRRSKATTTDEKRYIIELSEKQLRALSYVCDMYPRLIEGQGHAYQDLFEAAWEKRCKKATGKMMDDEFEGGWQKMREDAETVCNEIKRRFWDLAPNSDYGIHYDDYADMIWDMYQVMRHALWREMDAAAKEMTRWSVDAFPASQFGNEPMITVKPKEEE